ncbi:unnamed protein product [Brassica oleracea]
MMLARFAFRSQLRASVSFRQSASSCSPYSSSSAASAEAERTIREGPRNDWSRDEIKAVYDSPVLDLLFHGAQVHRHVHNFREVQQCTLLSIKTAGKARFCGFGGKTRFCGFGGKLDFAVLTGKLDLPVLAGKFDFAAHVFCMGAAWRDTIGRKTNFNQILDYIKEIRGMGMEVCCTLGMIEKQQALELKKAGLTAYNHNLDTSREYYPNVITTRSYDDRLETLEHVREAGINVCSGGIIGLGEAEEDRVGLLHTLATLPSHPESVPINALLAVKGTPLEDQKPVEIWEMIRMIGTARIVMPKAMVRLSAGRVRFTMPEQALCFLAGANSIFTGEKLLTTPNNDFDADQLMFKTLGLIPKPPSFSEDDSESENCEKDIEGNNVSLSKFTGKVLLIVNVASKCGLTQGNYKELNILYAKYKTKGLEILAFPCNQFGGQEPGSNKEIKENICTMFKGEFPIFDKIEVNGENASPLYKFLKEQKGGLFGDSIKWNFAKFLVDKQGNVVDRYAPTTSPLEIEDRRAEAWNMSEIENERHFYILILFRCMLV